VVILCDELVSPGYARLDLPDAKLPTSEGDVVCGGCACGDVEFEAGVVEADGLADGFCVGFFEGEGDAEAAEHGIVVVFGGDGGEFDGGELGGAECWMGGGEGRRTLCCWDST